MILEAKIIEVELKDSFQSGINWASLSGLDNTDVYTTQVGGGTLLSGAGLSNLSGQTADGARWILERQQGGGVKAELKSIRYSGRILLPYERDIEYDVIPSSQFHYVGTNYFFIEFRSKNRVIKKVKIEAETDMKVSVVFAARPIERGLHLARPPIETNCWSRNQSFRREVGM